MGSPAPCERLDWRADFVYAQSGAEGDGNVTYGEAFTVQPFGNSLGTMTLTGAQILDMLKSQWCGQDFPRVLLPSAGVEGDPIDPPALDRIDVTP